MLVVYSGTKPDEICDSFLQWGVVERGMIIASTFWNLFTNILLLIKIDTFSAHPPTTIPIAKKKHKFRQVMFPNTLQVLIFINSNIFVNNL
jgi:hypothetical protein